MEQNPNNINSPLDPIEEKLKDTAALEKVMKQAVFEAVDKAQRLGFLPTSPKSKQ